MPAPKWLRGPPLPYPLNPSCPSRLPVRLVLQVPEDPAPWWPLRALLLWGLKGERGERRVGRANVWRKDEARQTRMSTDSFARWAHDMGSGVWGQPEGQQDTSHTPLAGEG